MTPENIHDRSANNHVVKQFPVLRDLITAIEVSELRPPRIAQQVWKNPEWAARLHHRNLTGLYFEYHLHLVISGFLNSSANTLRIADLAGKNSDNYDFRRNTQTGLGTTAHRRNSKQVFAEYDNVLKVVSKNTLRAPVIVEAKSSSPHQIDGDIVRCHIPEKRVPLAEKYGYLPQAIPLLMVIIDDGTEAVDPLAHPDRALEQDVVFERFFQDNGILVQIPQNLAAFSHSVLKTHNNLKMDWLSSQRH